MIYFFVAYKALKKHNKELVVSCPSGNFGNICAGILGKKLGLPIAQFVASTNSNTTVSEYLTSGTYEPKPSKATISNAMDVGAPSNMERINNLFGNDVSKIKNEISKIIICNTASIN